MTSCQVQASHVHEMLCKSLVFISHDFVLSQTKTSVSLLLKFLTRNSQIPSLDFKTFYECLYDIMSSHTRHNIDSVSILIQLVVDSFSSHSVLGFQTMHAEPNLGTCLHTTFIHVEHIGRLVVASVQCIIPTDYHNFLPKLCISSRRA